jgi:hypothetical protein
MLSSNSTTVSAAAELTQCGVKRAGKSQDSNVNEVVHTPDPMMQLLDKPRIH